MRGSSSLGPEDTEARPEEGLDTHGYTTARIKDLKIIGHVDAIAVAAQMVYTLIGLVGSIPKPRSRPMTRYLNVPEPFPDANSFTRNPMQVLQKYDASAGNTLNKALS